MVRVFKRFWLIPLLVLGIALAIPRVRAAEPYAKIYPTEGDVFTDIYIEIRNLSQWAGPGVGGDTHRLDLYLFWDNTLRIEKLPQPNNGQQYFTYWYDYYDIHIQVPNETPYSDFGNHTVYIEIWRYDVPMFCTNFTLTFNIIQYFPPTSAWWKWWESVPNEIKANLTGAQGLQGIQGIQGEQGIQGIQGVKGDKGDKGDTGPYPLEAVQLNLSLSAVSVVTFIIAATMLYKTKKLAHST